MAIVFGEAVDLAAEVEAPVLTYVVPGAKTFYLSGFGASGGALGRYRLYIDGVPKASYNTSSADRNALLQFPIDEPVPPGSTVEVRVLHHGAGLLSFDASLYGTLR